LAALLAAIIEAYIEPAGIVGKNDDNNNKDKYRDSRNYHCIQ
jgi:hypothetical protein